MLDGKVAIVTGGASGIGAATARELVECGASVTIGDVDEERGRELAADLGEAAAFVHCDVTDEGAVAALVAAACGSEGRLDVMFNNAGAVGAWTLLMDTSVEEWDRAFGLLARSVFLGTKHAARAMRRAGNGGSIVNTASIAAIQAGHGPHPYGAAKAAVLQLTRSAAVELAPDRIRVNAVIPGGIATRIVGHGRGLTGPELDDSVDVFRRDLAGFQPYPRAGEPEDVARLVAYLANDGAEFVTGAVINVDGALTAGRPWPRALRDAAARPLEFEGR